MRHRREAKKAARAEQAPSAEPAAGRNQSPAVAMQDEIISGAEPAFCRVYIESPNSPKVRCIRTTAGSSGGVVMHVTQRGFGSRRGFGPAERSASCLRAAARRLGGSK